MTPQVEATYANATPVIRAMLEGSQNISGSRVTKVSSRSIDLRKYDNNFV